MARVSSLRLSSYTPPQKGLLYVLPASWIPYAELARINEPLGFLDTCYPFLIGAFFVVCISPWHILPSGLISTTLTLLAAAVFLQSACWIWRDIINADLDRRVARFRSRLVARGAIPVPKADLFLFSLPSGWQFSTGWERRLWLMALDLSPWELHAFLSKTRCPPP